MVIFNRGDHILSYPITASNLAAAEQCMLRQGPRDADGRHAAMCHIGASIRPSLSLEITPGETQKSDALQVWLSKARIRHGVLHIWADIDFPMWGNVASLSRPVQAEWRRFTNCLDRHERGHWRSVRPILQQYRADFDRLNVPGQGDTAQAAEDNAMEQLNTNIDELEGSMISEIRGNIVEYDYRYDHGRRQGARLNTSIR
ncbi:MAG: DUF922 domain-containing protein [Lentisphaerota bacterium]